MASVTMTASVPPLMILIALMQGMELQALEQKKFTIASDEEKACVHLVNKKADMCNVAWGGIGGSGSRAKCHQWCLKDPQCTGIQWKAPDVCNFLHDADCDYTRYVEAGNWIIQSRDCFGGGGPQPTKAAPTTPTPTQAEAAKPCVDDDAANAAMKALYPFKKTCAQVVSDHPGYCACDGTLASKSLCGKEKGAWADSAQATCPKTCGGKCGQATEVTYQFVTLSNNEECPVGQEIESESQCFSSYPDLQQWTSPSASQPPNCYVYHQTVTNLPVHAVIWNSDATNNRRRAHSLSICKKAPVARAQKAPVAVMCNTFGSELWRGYFKACPADRPMKDDAATVQCTAGICAVDTCCKAYTPVKVAYCENNPYLRVYNGRSDNPGTTYEESVQACGIACADKRQPVFGDWGTFGTADSFSCEDKSSKNMGRCYCTKSAACSFRTDRGSYTTYKLEASTTTGDEQPEVTQPEVTSGKTANTPPCTDVVEMIRDKFRNTLDKGDAIEALQLAQTNYNAAQDFASTVLNKAYVKAQEPMSTTTKQLFTLVAQHADQVIKDVAAGATTHATALAAVNDLVSGKKVTDVIKSLVGQETTTSAGLVEQSKDVKQELLMANAALAEEKLAALSLEVKAAEEKLKTSLTDMNSAEKNSTAAEATSSGMEKKEELAEQALATARQAITDAARGRGECIARAAVPTRVLELAEAEKEQKKMQREKETADEDAAEAGRKLEFANGARKDASDADSAWQKKKGAADQFAKGQKAAAEKEGQRQRTQRATESATAAELARLQANALDSRLMNPDIKYTFKELEEMKAEAAAKAGKR